MIMTTEQFEEIKTEYLEKMKEHMIAHGELKPSLTLFCDANFDLESEDKPVLLHIVIPDKFMASEESKDYFTNHMLKDIYSKFKDKYKPHAVAWISESWLREIAKEEKEVPKDYKKLPITKEAVIVSIETMEDTELLIYDIHRDGKKVNEEGELIDNIRLQESTKVKDKTGKMQGRFTGLLKKFYDQ